MPRIPTEQELLEVVTSSLNLEGFNITPQQLQALAQQQKEQERGAPRIRRETVSR